MKKKNSGLSGKGEKANEKQSAKKKMKPEKGGKPNFKSLSGYSLEDLNELEEDLEDFHLGEDEDYPHDNDRDDDY